MKTKSPILSPEQLAFYKSIWKADDMDVPEIGIRPQVQLTSKSLAKLTPERFCEQRYDRF